MSEIFLGRAWHWALLIAATGLLWYCGSARLHVIEFNLFILSLLAGTVAAVFALVVLHRPGDRITRDELVDEPAAAKPTASRD